MTKSHVTLGTIVTLFVLRLDVSIQQSDVTETLSTILAGKLLVILVTVELVLSKTSLEAEFLVALVTFKLLEVFMNAFDMNVQAPLAAQSLFTEMTSDLIFAPLVNTSNMSLEADLLAEYFVTSLASKVSNLVMNCVDVG